MYQLFVGEIGFPRQEFLHDIRWWEVHSIIRGYNARHHAGWEQARLIAYNAHYCMGSKETPPTVSKWLPFPWEKEQEASDLPDQVEVERLRELIRQENANLEKENGEQ